MADTAVKDGGKGASKRWAAEKDWERHRATITQLYIHENKTLVQVMEVMKKEFDFSATARMYKARFERWHLWKNERAVILSPSDSTDGGDDASKQEVLKRWATEEDWENQRATITQLYVKENRTLAKLMEIMEDEHKFHATPKMYKSRFKRWGLWKNTRAADVAEIIRQKAQRDAGLQPGEYYLNGKQVDIGKVEAYLKRRRKQLDNRFSEPRSPGDSNALVWRSPEPDVFVTPPSPTYLISPSSIKVGEDTFKAFRDYFEGSLSKGRWTFVGDSSTAVSTPEGAHGHKAMMRFYHRFKTAVPLLEEPAKSGAEGMRMLRICFAELPDVVQCEDPMLLWCILNLIRRIQVSPRARFLLMELLQQLNAAAAAVAAEQGHQHPTQQVWRSMLEGLKAEQEEYRPEQASPVVAEIMKRHLGAYHAKTIEWFTVITFLLDIPPEAQEQRLRSLCDAMDNLGIFDERHMGVRMNLISHMRKRPERYDDAVRLISEVLDDPERSRALYKFTPMAYNYMSMLAEIRQSQGNLAEAERLMRLCVNITRGNPEHEPDLLHALRELEDILRVTGQNEEADLLSDERRQVIKHTLENMGEEEGGVIGEVEGGGV